MDFIRGVWPAATQRSNLHQRDSSDWRAASEAVAQPCHFGTRTTFEKDRKRRRRQIGAFASRWWSR
jgi:hypothetical protein